MDDPLELVLQRLKGRGRSEQTKARFRLYVTKFLIYLKANNKSWKTADCNDVMDYLSESKVCGNTKATMFYAYRSIFKIWYIARGVDFTKEWTLERADMPSKSNPHQPFYTDDEINKIVATADKLSFQSAVIVRIGRDCGCRRAAIRQLERKDFIDNEEKPKLKIHSIDVETSGKVIDKSIKHSRPIDMPIAYDTAEAIRKMLSNRNDKNKYLFIRNGTQISLVQLSILFTKVAKLAGVYKPRAGIHAMRRAKVTRLRKLGADEFDIVEAMGWRPGSPMVHQYCQLDNEEIQDKIAAIDPFLQKGKKVKEVA